MDLEAFEKSFGGYGWAIEAFIVIFFALLFNFFFSRFFRKLQPKLIKSHKIWENALLSSLYRPLKFLIWLLSITFALEITSQYMEDISLTKVLEPLQVIGFAGALVWFLTLFIRCVEENLLHPKGSFEHRLDETSVRAIGKLMRIAVIITSSLVAFQAIGIPVSGIVAFGGVGGIAVGFAAKDLLANFFGGLMVFLDRPFSIGDWIRSPDREIKRTVEHIGWRTTRIRTFDKRPLFVPNSLFTTISIENPSRMSNRRIKAYVGVRYDDATKMRDVIDGVKEMLQNHPEIAQDKTMIVNLVEFGPSSLNFMIYTFTKTTNWIRFQEIQEDVFLKVIDVITSLGAECAFPTTTLHIPEGVTVSKGL